MKNKIDDIINEGLKEYANADTHDENTSGVILDEKYKKKMKAMFDNEYKNKNLFSAFKPMQKVAVIVIALLVVGVICSTSIKAWRESKLNMYEKDDKYSWILPNDNSGIYNQEDKNKKIKDIKDFFPTLYDELSDVVIESNSRGVRIGCTYNEKEVSMKISKVNNLGVNTENLDYEALRVGEISIYHYFNENDYYVWERNGILVTLCGNIENDSLYKLVEDLDYENFEEIF